jgi:hypothetical protein
MAGRSGLNLPDFSEKFVSFVRSYYRARVMEPVNPLDLGDIFDLEAYVEFVRRLLIEGRFGGVVLIVGLFAKEWGKIDNLLMTLRAFMDEFKRPVSLVIQGSRDKVLETKRKGIIPIFDTPEEAVYAIGISCSQAGERPGK